MNKNTTTAIDRDVIQRIKQLMPRNTFVPVGHLIKKLFDGMTDQQVLTLIQEAYDEKFNYIRPKINIESKPQQYIYPEPSAQ